MIYPENIVIEELMWEYDYTQEQAQSIVSKYKENSTYKELCEAIQHRKALNVSVEALCGGCLNDV